MTGPETRLIAYGTLRPGRSNHRIVSDVPGKWIPAAIEGVIDTRGHYPRFRPMRIGRWHEVEVLVSDALPKHWRRIDRFEGPHYRRAIIPVRLANRRVPASVYIGRSL